eukprot:SAG11_NODE_8284_length_1034_cov_17.397861_1_plen_150_part_00
MRQLHVSNNCFVHAGSLEIDSGHAEPENDGKMPDPANPAGARVNEPWTKWDVRRYRQGGGKVPVLGPGVEGEDGIEMDIYADRFDKYSDFLLLPAPKVKDLISHAAMLPAHKRPQYELLAAGREEELTALDEESISDRMELGLALRVFE